MTSSSHDDSGGSRPVYFLGIGCRRGAAPDELLALVDTALAIGRTGIAQIRAVATIDSRRQEAAVEAVARRFDLPLVCFPAEVLERQTPRLLTPSAAVYAATGCHGVAESAALAAAGPVATLHVAKIRSAAATVAIAVAAGCAR